jgi:hypothetical protein
MNELGLSKLIKRAIKLLKKYENKDLDDEQKQKLHLQLQEIREALKNSQNKR